MGTSMIWLISRAHDRVGWGVGRITARALALLKSRATTNAFALRPAAGSNKQSNSSSGWRRRSVKNDTYRAVATGYAVRAMHTLDLDYWVSCCSGEDDKRRAAAGRA